MGMIYPGVGGAKSSSMSYTCSYFDLFYNRERYGFENFISSVIDPDSTVYKDPDSILNNVLFVFEDISWHSLQYFLLGVGIRASGGSISRRTFLSSNEFRLCHYLINMNYKMRDVYLSQNVLSKKVKTGDDSELNEKLDRKLLIRLIHLGVVDKIIVLKSEIDKLVLDTSSQKGLRRHLLSSLVPSIDFNKTPMPSNEVKKIMLESYIKEVSLNINLNKDPGLELVFNNLFELYFKLADLNFKDKRIELLLDYSTKELRSIYFNAYQRKNLKKGGLELNEKIITKRNHKRRYLINNGKGFLFERAQMIEQERESERKNRRYSTLISNKVNKIKINNLITYGGVLR